MTSKFRTVLPVVAAAFLAASCTEDADPEGHGGTPLDPSADWSPDCDWAAKGLKEGEGPEDHPGADAAADAPYDSWHSDMPAESMPDIAQDIAPDIEPDDGVEDEDVDEEDIDEEEDMEEDVDEEDADEEASTPEPPAGEGGGDGDVDIDEPYVLYLSADDSNSQASPIIARWMIGEGRIVPWSVVRVHEFLNYYSMKYEAASSGEVNVSSQFRAVDYDGGLYALQVAVASEHMDPASRVPMNLTLVLDTSGSMSGRPIELERDVVRAIASQLKEGDVVSAVEWDTSRSIRLDSHEVTGPDDPAVLNMAAALESGGGTDLHAGLEMGYGLATRDYRKGWLNRVVLVSDGQANAGVTDVEIIASAAEDSEDEGIYLVGVGTGSGYNDTLMDELTDAGKGAYIFIDSTEEANKMFADRFFQSLQLAARDVQVELILPGVFRMEVFFGEEYSTNPAEVEPQHLAPNDAMVFHQLLRASFADKVYAEDRITVNVTYSVSVGGGRLTASTSDALQDLIYKGSPQMRKADSIVIYAQTLMRVSALLDEGESEAAYDACTSALSVIETSAAVLDDDELHDIADILAGLLPDRVPCLYVVFRASILFLGSRAWSWLRARPGTGSADCRGWSRSWS
ncbi:MAG: VWA domain-containing protein [Pseudomonadota bacterium]